METRDVERKKVNEEDTRTHFIYCKPNLKSITKREEEYAF